MSPTFIERRLFYTSWARADAKRQVRARDKHRCQRCDTHCGEGAGTVHHKKSWLYPPTRLSLSNLVLLCAECHTWVHSAENVAGLFIRKVGSR